MSVLLKPETAAKLAAQLFPDTDLETSLEAVLEWVAKYKASMSPFAHPPANNHSLSPTGEKIITSWNKTAESTKEQQESGELPLPGVGIGVRNNPQIKEMMSELLAHAKANKISASDLAGQVGASYPTILNWQRGKLPRGENIQKVAIYLKKNRK